MKTQKTQWNSTEGDQPGILIFRDAYQFTYERLAHEDQLAPPFDLAVGTDPSHLGQRRVLEVAEVLRIGAGREHIPGGRRHL
ncbi:MAG: hypothetical protein Q8O43_00480, partial [Dehalococcoidia bacterium]|nr:hypothetical protein [Dehalococcoidia bacterium]